MNRVASWRLALRLARREAARHRLRTLLTLLLVAAPVAGLVAAAVLVRSAQLPAAEKERRELGTADVLVYAAPSALAGRVPPGSRTAEEKSGVRRVHRLDDAAPRPVVEVSQLDYRDPLVAGVVHQRSGRAPAAAGEVALSPHLLGRLRLRVGDRVRLGVATPALLVVGVAEKPNELRSDRVFALPGSAPAAAPSTIATARFTDFERTWVGFPAGTDGVAAVARLGDISAVSAARNQPATARYSAPLTVGAVSTVALVVVLGLLQSALTAGTAFAVGARRQRRDLALLAVNGGTDRHVSRVVLANGALLGTAGALTGATLGLAAAPLAVPLLERYGRSELLGLRVDWRLVIAATVFGVVSALLAALTPARLAARVPARAALLGQRGQTRTPRWVTALGLVLLAIGLLVTLLGATSSAVSFDARTPVVLLGVVGVELGAVALCPVLVGAAGQLARLLPATPRLALRDAARQRARRGPAVAAVAAAVSGAVAVGVFVTSTQAANAADYAPPLGARDQVTLTRPGPVPGDDLFGLTEGQARGYLRGRAIAALAPQLPLEAVLHAGGDEVRSRRGGPVVGGPDLLLALGASPGAGADLDRVGVVVAEPAQAPGGRVALDVADAAGKMVRTVTLPAAVASWPVGYAQPSAVLSAAAARAVGLVPGLVQWRARLAGPLSDGDLASLSAATLDDGVFVAPSPAPRDRTDLAVLALLGVAAVVALLVTVVATVLAGTEARPDLAVLGAVGASPGVRRRFQAAQAAVIATIGGAIGLATGVVPAAAVVVTRAQPTPLLVPWQPFPVFLVGLPLVAALGGAVLTRSRLPGAARLP